MGTPILMVALLVGISYFEIAIADRPELTPDQTTNMDDFDELYLLPGCNFVDRQMPRWLYEPPVDKEDISDYFELDPTTICKTETVASLLSNVADQEATGEYVARILTDDVFRVRNKCPSALFCKFIALYLENRRLELLLEDSELFTLFNTKLIEYIPTFGNTPDILRQTVKEMVDQTWNHIIGDSARFHFRLEFQDVARLNHKAAKAFVDLPIDLQTSLSDAHCRALAEVLEMFAVAFQAKFELVEREYINQILADNLEYNNEEFANGSNAPEGLGNAQMDTLFGELEKFINESINPEFVTLSEDIQSLNLNNFVGKFNFLNYAKHHHQRNTLRPVPYYSNEHRVIQWNERQAFRWPDRLMDKEDSFSV